MRAVLVAATMAAAGAFAQSQPTPKVMTDVSPLPAEERESSGAIVLENSMVRAQRQAFLEAHYQPTRVGSIGRGVIRSQRAARTKEDLQQQRDDDAMRLHEMGAGALNPR